VAQGQAAAQLRAVELKVEVEIRQALARYQATVDRLNYVRGGATLPEVLEAQRTVDDVYLAYYQVRHSLMAITETGASRSPKRSMAIAGAMGTVIDCLLVGFWLLGLAFRRSF
jgi:hypothetical protein